MRVILALMVLLVAAPVRADTAATQMLNELRAKVGAAAISYDPLLEAAAQRHADDMARRGFFDHQGSDGSSVGERVTAQGYQWCFVAENIAQGQRSLHEVMQGWANSPGHYRNMIDRRAGAFGLATAPGAIWVMVLATRC